MNIATNERSEKDDTTKPGPTQEKINTANTKNKGVLEAKLKGT